MSSPVELLRDHAGRRPTLSRGLFESILTGDADAEHRAIQLLTEMHGWVILHNQVVDQLSTEIEDDAAADRDAGSSDTENSSADMLESREALCELLLAVPHRSV